MDEQQIIQFLNQIPLDVLAQYVQQRMQQEQAQTEGGYGQSAPEEAYTDTGSYGGEVPPEATAAAQQGGAPVMSYGGKLAYYLPDVNPYGFGGPYHFDTAGPRVKRARKR